LKKIGLIAGVLLIIGCSYTPEKVLTMVDYNSGIKQKVEREVALKRLEKPKIKKDTKTVSKERESSILYQKEASQYVEQNFYTEALSSLKKALKVEEDIYWSKEENIGRKKFATNCSAIKARQEKITRYLQKECRNHTIWDAPNLGEVYYRLAFVYSKLDKDKIALDYYERALEAKKIDIIGKDAQDTANFYNNLSLFFNKIKAYKIAFYYQKQASKIYSKLRLKASKRLTNEKKKKFLDRETYSMYNMVSLAFDYKEFLDSYLMSKPFPHNKDADFPIKKGEVPKERREVLRTAFKFWLTSKGEISNQENYLMESRRWASPELKLLIKIYLQKTREYSNLSLIKLAKAKKFSYEEQKELDAVTKEREMLEEYITPYVDGYSRNSGSISMQNPATIELSTISQNLNGNELYLDFLKTKEFYYLFTFDKKENIALYKLGRIKNIEQLVKRFREDVINKKESKKLGSLLYRNLLGKIPNINRYKQLVISPDGLLNLLPFEALWSQREKYLIEESSVVYVLSGKEIFKKREQDRHSLNNREIVSLFYVDYRFDGQSIKGSTGKKGRKDIDGIFHDFEKLSRLKSTKDEGAFIKNIFETNRSFMFREKNITKSPVTLLSEKNATKERLFSLNSPQILHLSTHSFYGEDDNRTTLNPLLKSVIALSKYNAVDNDDMKGIMSALEFSTLNLKDTELILFSSCQSGLGDIYSSEGVSGLNRGARMTGSRRVISTLWSVDEEKSLQLTETFYKHLLTHSSIDTLGHQYRDNFYYADALTATKRDMIHKKLHPLYWAGFVMYGLDSFHDKKINKFYSDMLDKAIDKAIKKPINKAVDKLFDKIFK
jgi:CHAT domain-containing protein